jgi:hypothetical protein
MVRVGVGRMVMAVPVVVTVPGGVVVAVAAHWNRHAVGLAGRQLLVGHVLGFGARLRLPDLWLRQRLLRQLRHLRGLAGVVSCVSRSLFEICLSTFEFCIGVLHSGLGAGVYNPRSGSIFFKAKATW